ncbi:MAG: hypothetical protein H7X97_06135 [Opitutaceae bacterium]|nr:hypothetical protein [Verrucomicrobiales bacterium]
MKMQTSWFLLPGLIAGALAGYFGFEPLLRRVCVGVFPQVLTLSTDALRLARVSFTLSTALLGLTLPVAVMLARSASRKSPAAAHAARAITVGSLCFVLAGLHYRHEMNKGWAYTREIFGIWGDAWMSMAMNPLTRMGLIAAVGVLAYGIGRQIFPRR